MYKNFAERLDAIREREINSFLEASQELDLKPICTLLTKYSTDQRVMLRKDELKKMALEVLHHKIDELCLFTPDEIENFSNYLIGEISEKGPIVVDKNELVGTAVQYLLLKYSQNEISIIMNAGFGRMNFRIIENFAREFNSSGRNRIPWDGQNHKTNLNISILCYEYLFKSSVDNFRDEVHTVNRECFHSYWIEGEFWIHTSLADAVDYGIDLYEAYKSKIDQASFFDDSKLQESNLDACKIGALKCLQLLYEFELPKACEELAKIYEEGKIFARDFVLAKKYWLDYAKFSKFAWVRYWVAKKFIFDEEFGFDYGCAYSVLSDDVAKNDSSCQYLLGYLFENGLGVDLNYQEAVKWYQLSSDSNDPNDAVTEAKASLAGLYEQGFGVDKDEYKAYQLYKQAASDIFDSSYMDDDGDFYERKHPLALLRMVVYLAEGKFEAQDIDKAKHLISKWRWLFSPSKDMFALASIYLDCKPLYDYEEGLACLRSSAYHGNLKAIDKIFELIDDAEVGMADSRVSDFYEKIALTVEGSQDAKLSPSRMAEFWYSKAMQHGSSLAAKKIYEFRKSEGKLEEALKILEAGAKFDGHDAKIELALHLLRDDSTVEDKERAVALLKDCHFNSIASGILGWCYKHGLGVKVDVDLAVNYLTDAANYADNNALFQYELADIFLDEAGKHFNKDLGIELLKKSKKSGFQLAIDALASIGSHHLESPKGFVRD